jgi:hypothetical protein
VHSGPATAAQHGWDSKDGQQTIHDTGVWNCHS